MLNLGLAYIPTLFGNKRDAEEGFLGKLALWARQRIRYRRALNELYRLDDRDLDDLGLARVRLPGAGLAPCDRCRAAHPSVQLSAGLAGLARAC